MAQGIYGAEINIYKCKLCPAEYAKRQSLGGHVSHAHGELSKAGRLKKKLAQFKHEEPAVPETARVEVAMTFVHEVPEAPDYANGRGLEPFVHEDPEIPSSATKEVATQHAHGRYELHSPATSQAATKYENGGHDVTTTSSLLGSSQVAARTNEVAARDRVAQATETKLPGLLKGPSSATTVTILPTVPEHEVGAGSKGSEATKTTSKGSVLAIAAVTTAVVGGLVLCGIAKKLKSKAGTPRSPEPDQQLCSIMDAPGYDTVFLA